MSYEERKKTNAYKYNNLVIIFDNDHKFGVSENDNDKKEAKDKIAFDMVIGLCTLSRVCKYYIYIYISIGPR